MRQFRVELFEETDDRKITRWALTIEQSPGGWRISDGGTCYVIDWASEIPLSDRWLTSMIQMYFEAFPEKFDSLT